MKEGGQALIPPAKAFGFPGLKDTMKVILTEDVKGLGKKGEVVDVNDSYARNVLIKGRKGVEATGKTLNDLKLRKANDDKVAAENLAKAKELAKQLEKASVTVSVKVGEGGRLFGSISSKEIADAAQSQLGLELDKKKIVLPTPIKAVGDTSVTVRLHPQVQAKLNVHVVEA